MRLLLFDARAARWWPQPASLLNCSTEREYGARAHVSDSPEVTNVAKKELDALKAFFSFYAEESPKAKSQSHLPTGVIPWAPDKFPVVPQQVGGVDCGVFAHTWQHAIAHGEEPAIVTPEHMPALRRRFLFRILFSHEDD